MAIIYLMLLNLGPRGSILNGPFEDCSGEDCPSTRPAKRDFAQGYNPESQRPRRLVVSNGATRIVTVALTGRPPKVDLLPLARDTLLSAVWTFLPPQLLCRRCWRAGLSFLCPPLALKRPNLCTGIITRYPSRYPHWVTLRAD